VDLEEEEDDESVLVPPPFPTKLIAEKKDKCDPPSSPRFQSTAAEIPTRSRSFHEPRSRKRKARARRGKTPPSIFHTIPEPIPQAKPKITHEQEFIFEPEAPAVERSPLSSSMSNLFSSRKKPQGLSRSSTYTCRRRPDRTVANSKRKSHARNRTVGVAQIDALNDHIFGGSNKRQAGAHPGYSQYEKQDKAHAKRKPSDSRIVDPYEDLRGDSPDTVTTVTSSDMNLTLESLNKTIIGKLSRRYSFANVYQCKRGSVVFKLAFHNSPFTGEGPQILSNVKDLFQFATLSIDYEGFECSLLEPIRRLDARRSYSDFDKLMLQLVNFHDGTLSGRFTGEIINMSNGSISRKVRIPLDVQFHCTVPSRDSERLAEILDHPSLDLVE